MVNSWAELYDIYVHSKAILAGLLQLNISIYGTCLEVRPKFISCRIYISPRYLMISLIVPKLETNFLQRNYLGRQSLAEADTLCDTFHFGPFKNTNSGYAIFLWNDPAKKNLPAMVWDIFTFENMYLQLFHQFSSIYSVFFQICLLMFWRPESWHPYSAHIWKPSPVMVNTCLTWHSLVSWRLMVNHPLDDRCIYLEFCDDFFRTQIIERQGTAMYY